MRNSQSTIDEPIGGTGSTAQAQPPTTLDLEKTAAIKRERRENRIVATMVATLGATLFVSCVTTELACAKVLSKALVQHRQRIQAAAIANPNVPSTEASAPGDSLSLRGRPGPVTG